MLSSREAELTALGMAMMDPLVAEKISVLPQDVFANLDTRSMFLGIRRVIEKHGVPDLVTVKQACMELGIDPEGAILEAARSAITSANYAQYETILMDFWRRRAVYRVCTEVAAHITDPSEDAEALMGQILEAVRETTEKPSSITARDAVLELIGQLERRKAERIDTGIAGIDRKLGGFRPKQLIVLGARPGVGKTALAIHIAEHVAMCSGPVLVVSLEMDAVQIMERILAKESGVDVHEIEGCDLKAEQWAAVWGESAAVAEMPMRLTTSATTPMQVRREAQAMMRDGGLKLIVIDYIQLMRADSPAKSRYEEITQISRELKLMTMELDVPILALTQFNRESEAKAGMKKRKPSMAEAKDSGSIEQDANVFMTLYSPEEPKQDSPEYEMWAACQSPGCEWQVLSIDKNRQGPCGMISLKFDKPHMRFVTLEMGDSENEVRKPENPAGWNGVRLEAGSDPVPGIDASSAGRGDPGLEDTG